MIYLILLIDEKIKSTDSRNPLRLSTGFNSNSFQSKPPNILLNQTTNCSVPDSAEGLQIYGRNKPILIYAFQPSWAQPKKQAHK